MLGNFKHLFLHGNYHFEHLFLHGNFEHLFLGCDGGSVVKLLWRSLKSSCKKDKSLIHDNFKHMLFLSCDGDFFVRLSD